MPSSADEGNETSKANVSNNGTVAYIIEIPENMICIAANANDYDKLKIQIYLVQKSKEAVEENH